MSYSITEKCTGCGACVRQCPVYAITGNKKELHSIKAAFCIECGACGRICPETAVLDDRGRPVAKMKKSDWPRPVINAELCYACENCVAVCPAKALAMTDDRLPLMKIRAVLAEPDRCVSCGWCRDNCLFDAITFGGAQ